MLILIWGLGIGDWGLGIGGLRMDGDWRRRAGVAVARDHADLPACSDESLDHASGHVRHRGGSDRARLPGIPDGGRPRSGPAREGRGGFNPKSRNDIAIGCPARCLLLQRRSAEAEVERQRRLICRK